MKKYLVDNGIHHRISCLYMFEQNGLAERKHRHLRELGLSMMFQSHLPLLFLVEAFTTANHIINLLPSAVLKNKGSHELLYNTKPDYTSLRVFGSACYLFLRSVQAHKLEPKSLQCVFLGYNHQYKGYRCLFPPTGKIYISRHTIFDEECHSFKDQYKHLVPLYETPLLKAWQAATLSHVQVNDDEQVTCILSVSLPPPAAADVVHDVVPNNHDHDNLSDHIEGESQCSIISCCSSSS